MEDRNVKPLLSYTTCCETLTSTKRQTSALPLTNLTTQRTKNFPTKNQPHPNFFPLICDFPPTFLQFHRLKPLVKVWRKRREFHGFRVPYLPVEDFPEWARSVLYLNAEDLPLPGEMGMLSDVMGQWVGEIWGPDSSHNGLMAVFASHCDLQTRKNQHKD